MDSGTTSLAELERILDRFITEKDKISSTLDSLTTGAGAQGASQGKEILAKIADAVGRESDIGRAIGTLGGSVLNARNNLVSQLTKAAEEKEACIADIRTAMSEAADSINNITSSINSIIDFS